MTSAKEKGIFKVFGDKYNVKAVTDLLTTLAKEYERKDEEKENNVKAQEEKKTRKKLHQMSLLQPEVSGSMNKTLEQKSIKLDPRHQLTSCNQ